ncbi:hypothetical protein EC973_003834 [Apophysomyces ossiformis]|uniref:SPT2 chromatin protein n=1 Tax=Apophysomyces ossiformis TaxID=679940 RepID=A0A8H7BX74_9FUNG|nr:hypothetical protein EC973_003834 [Apophysomyces ossiformis]
MLKGSSQNLSFEELMAQAAAVAKTQDQALAEKSRQKRFEMEEKKRREERSEKALKQKQQQYEQWREEQKRNLAQASEMRPRPPRNLEKKTAEPKNKPRTKATGSTTATNNTRVAKRGKALADAAFVSPVGLKKKPVHISFEELMQKAKEVPASKSAAPPLARNDTRQKNVTQGETKMRPKVPENGKPSSTQRASAGTRDTSSIFLKRQTANPKPSETNSSGSQLSARERIRLLYQDPVQKIDRQKRDRRSISETQRELRHAKGIYSDDEDETKTRDKRVYDSRANARPTADRYSSTVTSPIARPSMKRRETSLRDYDSQLRTPTKPLRSEFQDSRVRPNSRSITPESRESRVRPPLPFQRMPFSRSMEMRRQQRRPPVEEEEEDEELASFIVDDEEEDFGGDYSAEIGRIFRYDKKKYTNERFSDDDMEADASEVLREEKRSERIGRREDLMEERLEMERLKKRKLKGK